MAAWAAGVLALLVVVPLAAPKGFDDRLATHWNAFGEPNGSLPLWAVVMVPVGVWIALVVSAVFWRAARRWRGAVLVSCGVLLAGEQVSIVRANLHHADWRDADSVTVWAVVTVVASGAAGLVGILLSARPVSPASPGQGPRMDIPAGERRVWLACTENPWLYALSAVAGVAALAALLVGLGGLGGLTKPMWLLIVLFLFVSVAVLACSAVRVRVAERGMDVAFGPLGWPVRHWDAADIEWARTENRTPAQVGGWGYRLSGLGTTVMLRSGECLVIRAKGKNFAVSVDDAERGAALLNSLAETRTEQP
ncbi:DUF1648 domain-containing protein [Streptomyces sp. CG 926]|uniref:DUF1648 domain-containing protein n=1 Tax=Streptomyces sp. CG 926 TaxID=1882405 RepID=UPI000D6B99ED|nr:DUF1648 domain-containing protein [Streptomyces sp. CG 926]